MMSDEKLREIYREAVRAACFEASARIAVDAGLRAVAEAAVRAEREAAVPVAWCTRGFADTFEYAGSLEEAQRNRACYEQWCDSPDMYVPLQQQPEPLYLHPPQARATVPEGYALVPMKPTSAMLDRAVAMMLNVKVSGAYGWTQYARDLWETMLAAAASRLGDETEAHEAVVENVAAFNGDIPMPGDGEAQR